MITVTDALSTATPLTPEDEARLVHGEAQASVEAAVALLTGAKFNPNHDEQGRFSEGPGGGALTLGGLHATYVTEVEKYVAEHADDKYEVGVAIWRDGTARTKTSGSPDHVGYTYDDVEGAAVLVHNHPNGAAGPSWADIRFAEGAGVRALVVVTSEYIVTVEPARPPASGRWPDMGETVDVWRETLADHHDEIVLHNLASLERRDSSTWTPEERARYVAAVNVISEDYYARLGLRVTTEERQR